MTDRMERGGMGVRGGKVGEERETGMEPGTGSQAEERSKEVVVAEEVVEEGKKVHFGEH